MFSSLGTGSIPWLFVDEAGQAVPQAAAGAIWRSKRAVIVGDPFQIEPVVTIPEQIINNFSRYFGLDKTQIHTSLSVQSMADRANPYGWVTNDTWTGSPLRVHRRCIDPMFSIANEIAYNNMMYNSTFWQYLKPDYAEWICTGRRECQWPPLCSGTRYGNQANDNGRNPSITGFTGFVCYFAFFRDSVYPEKKNYVNR